ncbi:hypothetical protein [Halovivax gelatinilyticus]|uniref:hypothetical protein n=1 Tax=Halovivax gelatinilyticus TaxID=2961597 RepID=UPI0020CA9A81|nr:hypothetical protein [Halovivax gelatinilyticus]
MKRFILRREVLRRTASCSIVGATAVLGGCSERLLGFGLGNSTYETAHQFADGSRKTYDSVEARVEDLVTEYDQYGLWGTTGTDPSHEMEPISGWVGRETPSGHSMQLDHVVIQYTLPGEELLGNDIAVLWFWTGVQTTNDATVTALEHGIDLGQKEAMDDLSPKALEVEQESEAVDRTLVGFKGDTIYRHLTPWGEIPLIELDLSQETVEYVGDQSRFGEGGAFRSRWNGSDRDRIGLTGACIVRTDDASTVDAEWSATVTLSD